MRPPSTLLLLVTVALLGGCVPAEKTIPDAPSVSELVQQTTKADLHKRVRVKGVILHIHLLPDDTVMLDGSLLPGTGFRHYNVHLADPGTTWQEPRHRREDPDCQGSRSSPCGVGCQLPHLRIGIGGVESWGGLAIYSRERPVIKG
jgi:hypothetical protein